MRESVPHRPARPAPGLYPAIIFVVFTCVSARHEAADSRRIPEAAPGTRVVEIAPGVHLLQHPDATEDWPQGNTIVIEGDKGLFVVDSAYLPSTARSDLRLIRKLSRKPVRYLLNTHWHYDHNLGNAVYAEAWPAAEIIAQAETRRIMDANVAGYPARVIAPGAEPVKTLATLREQLATGKTAGGKPLSDAEREALRRNIAARENEMTELSGWTYARPTMTFDQLLTIDIGHREVSVRHMLRGNTPGDAFVYLQQEKILITGDLLVAPVPFAFNCYPAEWIRTLHALADLDAKVIIPGHGPAQNDATYLRQVTSLLQAVVSRVKEATGRGLRLEETRKLVTLDDFRKQFAGDDPVKGELFDEVLLRPVVERAFMEATGQI